MQEESYFFTLGVRVRRYPDGKCAGIEMRLVDETNGDICHSNKLASIEHLYRIHHPELYINNLFDRTLREIAATIRDRTLPEIRLLRTESRTESE